MTCGTIGATTSVTISKTGVSGILANAHIIAVPSDLGWTAQFSVNSAWIPGAGTIGILIYNEKALAASDNTGRTIAYTVF